MADTDKIRDLAEAIKELRSYNPIGALSRQDFAYYMEKVVAALQSIPTDPVQSIDPTRLLVGASPAMTNAIAGESNQRGVR